MGWMGTERYRGWKVLEPHSSDSEPGCLLESPRELQNLLLPGSHPREIVTSWVYCLAWALMDFKSFPGHSKGQPGPGTTTLEGQKGGHRGDVPEEVDKGRCWDFAEPSPSVGAPAVGAWPAVPTLQMRASRPGSQGSKKGPGWNGDLSDTVACPLNNEEILLSA